MRSVFADTMACVVMSNDGLVLLCSGDSIGIPSVCPLASRHRRDWDFNHDGALSWASMDHDQESGFNKRMSPQGIGTWRAMSQLQTRSSKSLSLPFESVGVGSGAHLGFQCEEVGSSSETTLVLDGRTMTKGVIDSFKGTQPQQSRSSGHIWGVWTVHS